MLSLSRMQQDLVGQAKAGVSILTCRKQQPEEENICHKKQTGTQNSIIQVHIYLEIHTCIL
jgi:hypothetical protein